MFKRGLPSDWCALELGSAHSSTPGGRLSWHPSWHFSTTAGAVLQGITRRLCPISLFFRFLALVFWSCMSCDSSKHFQKFNINKPYQWDECPCDGWVACRKPSLRIYPEVSACATVIDHKTEGFSKQWKINGAVLFHFSFPFLCFHHTPERPEQALWSGANQPLWHGLRSHAGSALSPAGTNHLISVVTRRTSWRLEWEVGGRCFPGHSSLQDGCSLQGEKC